MDVDDPRAVAQRLEWVRHYFGKSAKQIAGDLDVMPSTYSSWLNGEYGLSLDGARRLYKKYDISLDFLYFARTECLPEKARIAWEMRP